MKLTRIPGYKNQIIIDEIAIGINGIQNEHEHMGQPM